MPTIDFENLLTQADQLRDSAQVNAAIVAYKDIAKLATDSHEQHFKARSLHMAGVAAKLSVMSIESSYYRDALNYFSQAQQIYQELNDQKSLGALYRDVAMCADYANDAQTAVNYFQKAISVLEPTEFYGELGITYDKLGLHFFRIGQEVEAQSFIDKALQLFKKEPTAGYFRATTLYDAARIQYKLGNLEQSYDLAEESLGWFLADHPDTNYERRLAGLYGLLAIVCKELGRPKDSENYYLKYQELLKGFDALAVKVIASQLQFLGT